MCPKNTDKRLPHQYSFFLILVICFLFTILIPLPTSVADGTGNYPAPSQGDWAIENDTHVFNETIILYGDLNVTNNSTLTLENVKLLFNSSLNISREIYVDWGATLNIYNSSISSLNKYYSFEVNGNMTIEHSNISHTTGGIFIKYGDVLISNSTLHHNYGAALTCFGSPTITNNYIHSNNIGIATSFYSGPYIYNNTIKFNEWGMISNAVGLATIIGNDVSNNSEDGIVVELGHLEIHENTIASNGGYGIKSDHASINATNNYIYDNKLWGIYSLKAPIFQEDNYFEKNGKYNSDGDVVLVWEVLIRVFDANNESVHGVNLTVYDFQNNLVWSGDTAGNARSIRLREYELKNNGTKTNRTPHTVLVKKDIYSNATTFDVSESKPAIFESLTVDIILEIEDKDETVIDSSPSEWIIWLISIIWLIALIFFVIGFVVTSKKRRK
jgi:parallel beta-helix repeat protein